MCILQTNSSTVLSFLYFSAKEAVLYLLLTPTGWSSSLLIASGCASHPDRMGSEKPQGKQRPGRDKADRKNCCYWLARDKAEFYRKKRLKASKRLCLETRWGKTLFMNSYQSGVKGTLLGLTAP